MKSVDQYEDEGCDDLRRKNHFEKQKKICQPYLKYCSGVFGGGGAYIISQWRKKTVSSWKNLVLVCIDYGMALFSGKKSFC